VNDGKKEFWKKIRSRNEALDTEIYAMAAYHSLRLDQQQIKNILDALESGGKKIVTEKPNDTNQPGENFALRDLDW
ncbi:MAG: phage terminase large subunit family protein, partial [Ignavibacteriales bacterium]|nr:phage terminase large subunit family protein [Ignavibacteriales bacterium]